MQLLDTVAETLRFRLPDRWVADYVPAGASWEDVDVAILKHGEVTIAYDIEGDGPWLTLLHGFSQNRHLWSAQREEFSRRYRLLTVDLRGHGESSASGGYGPVEYGSDVLALLDALDIRCTHLWGTHTGASIGLYLAALHPDRIASLVLDGAVIPGVRPPVVEQHMAWARDMCAREGVSVARRKWFENAVFWESIRRDPERHRAAEHRRIIESFSGAPWLASEPPQPVPDMTDLLPSIRQPALLINGVDDEPSFLATAERLEHDLPHVRRYLIPGTGGFPFWEQPEAVNPVVMQFLDEID
jgi:pimeloyl-ACP methyl ester carboxylesterase